MKLDEDNPCPHCGNIQTLTDRKEDDFRPVIPEDVQYDFQKNIGDDSNIFIIPSPQESFRNDENSTKISLITESEPSELPGLPEPPKMPDISDPEEAAELEEDVEKLKPVAKRVSQDIPLEDILPIIENVSLDPASQKVYFQLSIEFQIILNNAPNYREGLYRWSLLLPERLQNYGLTEEAWGEIARQGDADAKIQENLTHLIKKIFG